MVWNVIQIFESINVNNFCLILKANTRRKNVKCNDWEERNARKYYS